YIVLNEDNVITDFNETFLTMFSLKSTDIRNISIFNWDKSKYLPDLEDILQKVSVSSKTTSFEVHRESVDKHSNVEVSSIVNKNVFLGTLILFKDITQHIHDLNTIQDNQDMLIERERFASLGQMIGGIAHNLKTPIMSIAGAVEALNDLITEYDTSIGDPEVTNEDHHAIAEDMRSWVSKVKTHTSYMSDVITAVKGQAVSSNENIDSFTIDELVKRASILMKHDLKHALVELNLDIKIDPEFTLHGNINALVQVIDNLISNAIQSYAGEPDNVIDFIIDKQDNSLILSIKDYGCGMSPEIQDKLFKEMITTKGKNGTGLGLFMSYSNIKAKFNGNITFTSEIGKGTTFNIILPL
ncbi:MAG: histidine kinase, partial [Clostridia bacterium]|nr:histidine kinase [Clostridia bacterium]